MSAHAQETVAASHPGSGWLSKPPLCSVGLRPLTGGGGFGASPLALLPRATRIAVLTSRGTLVAELVMGSVALLRERDTRAGGNRLVTSESTRLRVSSCLRAVIVDPSRVGAGSQGPTLAYLFTWEPVGGDYEEARLHWLLMAGYRGSAAIGSPRRTGATHGDAGIQETPRHCSLGTDMNLTRLAQTARTAANAHGAEASPLPGRLGPRSTRFGRRTAALCSEESRRVHAPAFHGFGPRAKTMRVLVEVQQDSVSQRCLPEKRDAEWSRLASSKKGGSQSRLSPPPLPNQRRHPCQPAAASCLVHGLLGSLKYPIPWPYLWLPHAFP